jgi:hypothetical protein
MSIMGLFNLNSRPRRIVAEDNRYLHIRRFMDRVRSTDMTSGRPVVFTVQEVQNLSADITKLLLDSQQTLPVATAVEFPTAISGGGFKK